MYQRWLARALGQSSSEQVFTGPVVEGVLSDRMLELLQHKHDQDLPATRLSNLILS